MQKRLLSLSFVEGAAVMVAELCGAKLLAPIYGSSLYVWATVLGITLFALASGYFTGGRISSRSKDCSKSLFQVLNAAALFLLAMPLFSHYLVPRISYLPFLPGLFLSVGLLLFLPVFLLGASSPLFILIQSKEVSDAGKVSGMVYAISTLGGIFSTFLCGFYLIPQYGLQVSVISFGALLFFCNWLLLKRSLPLHFVLAFGLAYLNYQIWQNKLQLLFHSDGIMGKLVVETIYEGEKEIRLLKLNEIIQTEMNMKSKKSVSKYVQVMDSLIPFSEKNAAALVLGLGGGLTANLFVAKNYKTEAVEFDERIIEASKNYFYLNKAVRTYCLDARRFLNTSTKLYDLVLVDVFKAEEQPSYVITKESLQHLKSNLNKNAIVLINWHGYLQGEKGVGTAILYQTLLKSGYDVQLCAYPSAEDQRNLIFVASLSKLGALPYALKEKPMVSTLINTDDLPRLEKYNAEANKTWRSLYLRHYQGIAKN